jgi:ParB-like nuclease family protein
MAIETKIVAVDRLLFDPQNPRLPEELGGDQRQLFRYLVDDIGVDDLLSSLAASGAIEGDPFIGRPADRDGYYFVIEGNRRLAAIKLLNGEKIADGKPEPGVPEVTPKIAATLKQVKIQTGWDPEKLEAYLGYKHVTAAREWTPEAKAKFVITRCKDDYSDANLSKFAKRLGTDLPTLRRWLVAYLTLKQAEAEGRFNPGEAYAKRYFGTFYTLLGSSVVQEFLGLKPGTLKKTPVPRDHLGKLAEFIGWAIGTKKSPPVVNSRSQQKLDFVLASPSALRYFRAKKNLEGALLYTEFNSGEIAEKLLTAAYTIEECLPKIFDVKNDPKVISAIENLDRAFEKLKINTTEQTPQKTQRK